VTDFKYGEIVKLTDDGIRNLVERGYDHTITKRDNEFMVYQYLDSYRLLYLMVDCKHMCSVGHNYAIKTGKMIDFGKHPFKDYYLNGVKPDDLPPHTYKHRVLDFVGTFGYDFLQKKAGPVEPRLNQVSFFVCCSQT